MTDGDLHSYCKRPPGYDSDMDDDEDELVYCICRTNDTSRFMIGCDSCNEWYHGDCISITEEYAKNIQQFFCLMCRERDPSLEIKFKDKKDKGEKKKSSDKFEFDFRQFTSFEDYQNKRSARRCGECVACYRTEDCRRCDFCKDKGKFGGPNKIHQKCRQRQCMNFGLIFGKKPKFFPGFPIEDVEDAQRLVVPLAAPDDIVSNAFKMSNDEDEDDDNDRDADYQPSNRPAHVKPRHKVRNSRQPGRRKSHRVDHRKKHSEKEKSSKKKDDDMPRQCHGPGCVYAARQTSKYCSDNCGIKLAQNRIYEVLPHRIAQSQAIPCVADENNRKSLEKIRREQQEAKDRLTELNRKADALERVIQKAKHTSFVADQESLDGESDETDISVYCVTCGHEINAKNALKHMEKCFNKYESQTSFGSFYQTNIEGNSNIFCDFYNAQQKTYCKRLKILCPEHSKEPKVRDDEVCGCPLTKDMLKPSGEFCRALKKKCVKHYQWEKFRRAEIDLDKMRVLFKLDDLIEQERSIRQQMVNRGGVLGLMLHQTIYNKDAFDFPIKCDQFQEDPMDFI